MRKCPAPGILTWRKLAKQERLVDDKEGKLLGRETRLLEMLARPHPRVSNDELLVTALRRR